MNDEGSRSRIVGALLWSVFGAAALVLVMFTFVAAFGSDSDPSTFVGSPQEPPPPLPRLSTLPLCPSVPGGPEEEVMNALDAWSGTLGLTPRGEWTAVAAHATLPSAPGECALVALTRVKDTAAFDVVPSARCGGTQATFSIVCGTPVLAGSSAVHARVFTSPLLRRADIDAAGIPPLVYAAHVLLERELLRSPYRAGTGVSDIDLAAPGQRTPPLGRKTCVLWVGVAENRGFVEESQMLMACPLAAEIPALTQGHAPTLWLRPYARRPGPNVETAREPAQWTLRALRKVPSDVVAETANGDT